MLRYPDFAISAPSRQGCSKRSPFETTRRSTPAARTSGSLCMAAKDPSSAKTSRSQSDSGLSEPLARDPSNQTDETEGYRLVREPRYSQSARCSIAHPFYPRTALRDRVVGIPGSMEHNGTHGSDFPEPFRDLLDRSHFGGWVVMRFAQQSESYRQSCPFLVVRKEFSRAEQISGAMQKPRRARGPRSLRLPARFLSRTHRPRPA